MNFISNKNLEYLNLVEREYLDKTFQRFNGFPKLATNLDING